MERVVTQPVQSAACVGQGAGGITGELAAAGVEGDLLQAQAAGGRQQPGDDGERRERRCRSVACLRPQRRGERGGGQAQEQGMNHVSHGGDRCKGQAQTLLRAQPAPAVRHTREREPASGAE